MGRTMTAAKRGIQKLKRRIASVWPQKKQIKKNLRKFWRNRGEKLLLIVIWLVCGIAAGATVLPGKLAPFGIALCIGVTQTALIPIGIGVATGSLIAFSGLWAVRQTLAVGLICVIRILLGKQCTTWAGIVGVVFSGILSQLMAAMGETQAGPLFWVAQGCLALGLGWFLQQANACCQLGELFGLQPEQSECTPPESLWGKGVSGLPDPLIVLCLLSVWFTVCCVATSVPALVFGRLRSGSEHAATSAYGVSVFVGIQGFASLVLGTFHREELLGILWAAGILSAVTVGKGLSVLPVVLLASWIATHLPLQRLGQGIVYFAVGLLSFFAVETPAEFGRITLANVLVLSVFWSIRTRQLIRWEDILLRPMWMTQTRLQQDSLDGLQLLAGSLQAVAAGLQYADRGTQVRQKSLPDPVEEACEQICGGCVQKAACWGKQYDETIDAMQFCLDRWRENYRFEFPEWFCCTKKEALRTALLRAENMRVLRRAGQMENGLLCNAVSKQYAALAEGLAQFGREWQPAKPNPALESRVWAMCVGLKLPVRSVEGWRQSDGSPEITLQLKKVRMGKDLPEALCRQLSLVCGCEIACQVRQHNGLPLLRFVSEPPYYCRVGWAQKALQEVCGDVVEQLTGEKQDTLLLCDGMGTGSRAATDARTTALFIIRLLRAGFSADVAARMAEGVFLAGNPGERGSTLDAVTLHRTTGQAALYKAGGCPSFLVRRGRVQQLGCGGTGLPLGGGTPLHAGELTVQLQPGDWLFMVTDGVINSGTRRLNAVLTRLSAMLPSDADPRKTAEGLLPLVTQDTPEDDCTLVAIKICCRRSEQKAAAE